MLQFSVLVCYVNFVSYFPSAYLSCYLTSFRCFLDVYYSDVID